MKIIPALDTYLQRGYFLLYGVLKWVHFLLRSFNIRTTEGLFRLITEILNTVYHPIRGCCKSRPTTEDEEGVVFTHLVMNKE